MRDQKNEKKQHPGSFIFDYYPLGIPLVFDAELDQYVTQNLARGVDGSVVLADFFNIYLEEMRSGSERGKRIKAAIENSLEKSGVNCIGITMGSTAKSFGDYDNVATNIAWWKMFLNTFDKMFECHNPYQAKKASLHKKIAIIYCIQDGGCIGDNIDLLDTLYAKGVRIVQIALNRANKLGYGSTDSPEKGLTELGKKAIRRMNDIGMVVDVSHCNYQTTLDTIKTSSRPVMVSHSGCKSVYMHQRCKTDEEIKALAEKDGYFGVFLVPSFLSLNPEPDFNTVIDHLKHAITIMGIDRVGISSDWGLWSPDVPRVLNEAMLSAARKTLGFGDKVKLVAGTAPGRLRDYSDMYMVPKELAKAGFSNEQIKKIMGENFISFWIRANK